MREPLLVGNSPDLNRGCEALAVGTAAALVKATGSGPIKTLYFLKDGVRPNLGSDPNLRQVPIRVPAAWTPRWSLDQGLKRLIPPLYRVSCFHPMDAHLGPGKVALSVGGDHYSLDYGYPHRYLELNRHLADRGTTHVLWGASVGPFTGHPRETAILRNLRENFAAVYVREERSAEYLRACGYRGLIVPMSDPAFLLEPQEPPKGKLGFEVARNSIGLNLNPLSGDKLGLSRAKWYRTCEGQAAALLESHKGPVVLISHDTRSWCDDHDLARHLMSRLGPRYPQLRLAPNDLTAAETKWLIGRMRALLAGRFHATIASFGSAVPTVSIAFSIKAYGINRKLFGHERYLLDHRETDAGSLVKALGTVLREEDKVRARLRSLLPRLRQEVRTAAEHLRDRFLS